MAAEKKLQAVVLLLKRLLVATDEARRAKTCLPCVRTRRCSWVRGEEHMEMNACPMVFKEERMLRPKDYAQAT